MQLFGACAIGCRIVGGALMEELNGIWQLISTGGVGAVLFVVFWLFAAGRIISAVHLEKQSAAHNAQITDLQRRHDDQMEKIQERYVSQNAALIERLETMAVKQAEQVSLIADRLQALAESQERLTQEIRILVNGKE